MPDGTVGNLGEISSDLDPFPTPRVFCTYFYNHNHAHRLRLCVGLYTVLIEVPTDILNQFWVQVAVLLLILKPPHGSFRSETGVTLPFQKRNGYKCIL